MATRHVTRKKSISDPRTRDDARAGPRGRLVIIGGKEDKEGDREILQMVAKTVGRGKLVVATMASAVGDEQWDEYRELFRELEVGEVVRLHAEDRSELLTDEAMRIVNGASGVFFAGGDQLKLTALFGGTPACEQVARMFWDGGLIAGTSAGAAAMCDTMLVAGSSNRTARVGADVQMAPGLAFIRTVIIDQHFAERGRIGRLMAAVAENPRLLGIGIDEDTAVVIHENRTLDVIGKGGVYVLDASRTTHTNCSDKSIERTLCVFDVKVHLLSKGCHYDLVDHRPSAPPDDGKSNA